MEARECDTAGEIEGVYQFVQLAFECAIAKDRQMSPGTMLAGFAPGFGEFVKTLDRLKPPGRHNLHRAFQRKPCRALLRGPCAIVDQVLSGVLYLIVDCLAHRNEFVECRKRAGTGFGAV